MNIEEEKKAFLIHYPPAQCLNFSDGKWLVSNASVYQENVLVVACVRWDSWLAAKEHAVEMEKPLCEVYKSSTSDYWVVDPSCYDAFDDFASEEEAVAWAKENGYRVVKDFLKGE